MRRTGSSGFTVLELVIALTIGVLLTSIALASFGNALSSVSVQNAKRMYATLHQRARARSVEMGQTVLFYVDTAGDSAFIVSNGQITDVTRFDEQLNVDLRSPNALTVICMTPRGYAEYNCGSAGGFVTGTTASTFRLEFWQNADSASVLVLPMGQLVGM